MGNNCSCRRISCHRWIAIVFLGINLCLWSSLPLVRNYWTDSIWFLDELLGNAWWYSVNSDILYPFIYGFVVADTLWLVTQIPKIKRMYQSRRLFGAFLTAGVPLLWGLSHMFGRIYFFYTSLDDPTLWILFYGKMVNMGVLIGGMTLLSVGLYFLYIWLRRRRRAPVLPTSQI